MSVYEYQSYKKFMRDQIERLRKPGLMTELAKSAGCDRTYLSQVLSGKAHLTPDHAINLAEAFSLQTDEADFFLHLLLRERSANPSARKKIDKKLQRLREENFLLSREIQKKEVTSELGSHLQMQYYSSWLPSAVHILSSIPGKQDPFAMAEALHVPEEEIHRTLETLQGMNLVTRHGSKFSHSGGNIHLPSSSPLIGLNHVNWRLRAMEKLRTPGVHYTNVFSISADDVPALSAQLMESIEKQRKHVHQSGAEKAYAFCCDLFEV